MVLGGCNAGSAGKRDRRGGSRASLTTQGHESIV
jgi:hypothetical protein